jgi:hypothetical protein
MTRSSWRKRCVETKEAMVDLRIEILSESRERRESDGKGNV